MFLPQNTFFSISPPVFFPRVLLERRLQLMPTSANLALSEVADAKGVAAGGGGGEGGEEAVRAALGKLVRSKGFMWLAFSDKAAMYWSHAGKGPF